MKIKIIKAEQHGRLATYSIDQYGGWELDGSTSGELYNFELWSGYHKNPLRASYSGLKSGV
ncbi:hypothetical protein COV21_03350 [Candidatus Woesearchaeota archaeon CG10_big_fil_rev_8_21_14_0_10_45_5]|nr:MAG: hypothetical protein COV21_03350 [Candidatus Woesearchaeota archaeon CG10_big_fil_rev_8_21_14_0_10_45_5]PIU30166.1 MAG: hypothetical protein COT07_02120 [Candidatus Woesearchaeota archaeon CG07_land_8_20_14_0_80_44_23]